jgi:hypothetical protein
MKYIVYLNFYVKLHVEMNDKFEWPGLNEIIITILILAIPFFFLLWQSENVKSPMCCL